MHFYNLCIGMFTDVRETFSQKTIGKSTHLFRNVFLFISMNEKRLRNPFSVGLVR